MSQDSQMHITGANRDEMPAGVNHFLSLREATARSRSHLHTLFIQYADEKMLTEDTFYTAE